jgi:hypothetical protein
VPATSEVLTLFFARYAEGVRTLDVDIITGSYAESYACASPSGAVCARNDAGFRDAFAPWRARFESLGFRMASIRSVDATPLDARFTLARVGWRMRFERAGAALDVDFDETYVLLQRDDDAAPHIVLTISHESEEQTLRAAALLGVGPVDAVPATAPPDAP